MDSNRLPIGSSYEFACACSNPFYCVRKLLVVSREVCKKAGAVDEDGHRVVPSEETKHPNGEHDTMADEMRIVQ